MKKMKKIVSLLLAMVMALAMTATVFAATVTVASDEILSGHTFTAYQVFAGTEADGVLSDIQWGNGIDEGSFLTALQNDKTYGSNFASCTDAAAVAKVLADKNTDTALANAVAKLAYANKTGSGTPLTAGENNLDNGYYLVVDTTATVADGSAYNTALLQVVGNITITAKTDAPTVEKKVKEDDKYNQDGGYGTGYNDVADYNMGDAVPFHLIGSVPDMSHYDTYKYIFHDTLSNGLTAPQTSGVKVYLSNDKTKDDSDTDITTNFDVSVTGQNINVECANLKLISGTNNGKFIIVEYTATLNQAAVVGLDGNPNTVYLEYSNKPDQSGSGDTNNTGNTPEDKVIVFTYELDTTKVDGQDNTKKLQDAEFKLCNADSKWAIVDANGKVTGWANSEEEGTTLKSDAKGLFKVIGLDDGTYHLKETKAPTGYNLLTNAITVVITATTTNGQTWTDGQASSALTNLAVTADGTDGTGVPSTGIAGITVANNKGHTLPETGGMGTTLIYVIGAVLVLGAAVLLVAKKRTGAEK